MKIMGRIFTTEVGRAIERALSNGDRDIRFDPPVPAEEPVSETKSSEPKEKKPRKEAILRGK